MDEFCRCLWGASTKYVEASRINVGDMLLEAEVDRDNNSKHSGVLLWCNNIHCKLQRVKGEVLQRASCTSPEHLGLVHVQIQSIAGHPLVNVPDTVFQSDDSRCCVVGERQWSLVCFDC